MENLLEIYLFLQFFFRKLTQTTWLQDRSALLRHWHEEVGAIPAMASENCWKIGGKTTLSHGLCRFIIHGMGYTMGYKEEIHGLYLIHVFFHGIYHDIIMVFFC